MNSTPPPLSSVLSRLNVIQTQHLKRERTAKDYAIEFGGYLADAADAFMAEQNRAFDAEETPNPDSWSALASAIYEFRKRAAKTSPTR